VPHGQASGRIAAPTSGRQLRHRPHAYRGPIAEIGEAYECLRSFVEQERLTPVGVCYEIPDSWLFDADYNARTRINVSVRVEPGNR
jgi:hypothetical protein